MRPRMPRWQAVVAMVALVVVVIVVGVAMVYRSTLDAFTEPIAGDDARELLTLVTATAAGCAALAALLAHDRLTEPFWVALAFYAVVVVPAESTTMSTFPHNDWDLSYAVAVAVLIVLTLLPAVQARPMRPAARWLAASAVAIVVASTALEQSLPREVEHALVIHAPVVALEVVWLLSGLYVAVRGAVAGHGPLALVGAGMALLAVNHIAWSGDGMPEQPHDVTFSVVRALAFAVILAGLTRGWVSLRREMQRRELVRERSTAEWRHEVNNVLTGLESVRLLSRLETGARRDSELETAFCDELSHLAHLVAEREDRPRPTAVASVVSRCVSMRQAAGDVVDVRTEPREEDVRVDMSDLTLAGVITNLLLNCHRHAPGAHVVVEVGRVDERVLIEVTDDGPGLLAMAPVSGNSDFDTRHPHGIGLAIVRRTVREHGGTLRLGAGQSGRGTRATVILPLADEAHGAQRRNGQDRREWSGG